MKIAYRLISRMVKENLTLEILSIGEGVFNP